MLLHWLQCGQGQGIISRTTLGREGKWTLDYKFFFYSEQLGWIQTNACPIIPRHCQFCLQSKVAMRTYFKCWFTGQRSFLFIGYLSLECRVPHKACLARCAAVSRCWLGNLDVQRFCLLDISSFPIVNQSKIWCSGQNRK